ncbi:TrkH family potassium uptake protein [Salinicoccus sp. HZC-1]|uniref:TrkH family potassium uptake protein n=1 Tax=Salinicoccus sp. HZC-1 TaxID=3385497 RepID=UPI00398B6B28
MIKWIKSFFHGLSPQRWLFLYYLLALLTATFMLSIPFLYRGGKDIPMVDVLFVAASALSVTGLTPVTISETFNTYGYIVIMLIMNLGGIGIMAMGTLIWVFFGVRIGLRERMQIMVDNNQHKISGVVRLVMDIFKTLLLIELVGAFIYVIIFMNQSGDVGYAILNGVFLSVSATTNGGMDIFGNSLLNYTENYVLQLVVTLQIILGAIGFPVLIELRNFISSRKKKFRFSLFTKVTTATYGILLAVGTFFIFIMESQNYFENDSWFKTLSNSFFASATSRSGGLTTVDPAHFADGTQVVMSGLMFIGASPSSAGGGIRTTTFALLILFVIAFSRGRDRVNVFNREVAREDLNRAFAVISLAVMLVFAGIVSIVMIEDSRFDLIDVIFEVTSAFGTCGLSTGITNDLSSPSKFIIMMFMFIGRIGFISFLFSIGGRQHELPYHYPKERILIG